MEFCWGLGKAISEKVQREDWGKGVVRELAGYIAAQAPEIKGFSDKNLWRMKQFYETYSGDEKLSPLLRELHPGIESAFKDNYLLEFLGRPEAQSENDLQKALVRRMKDFILELGPDFIFMGEEYRLQVGARDFYSRR